MEEFAQRYVDQIINKLTSQIPKTNSSVWKVELQQPIHNSLVQKAIQDGVTKKFPGLDLHHEIITPSTGMMRGSTISCFTVTMNPMAKNDIQLNKLLGHNSNAIPAATSSSSNTQSMVRATPQTEEARPQNAGTKTLTGYFDELLGHLKNKDNNGYKATLDLLQKDFRLTLPILS